MRRESRAEERREGEEERRRKERKQGRVQEEQKPERADEERTCPGVNACSQRAWTDAGANGGKKLMERREATTQRQLKPPREAQEEITKALFRKVSHSPEFVVSTQGTLRAIDPLSHVFTSAG